MQYVKIIHIGQSHVKFEGFKNAYPRFYFDEFNDICKIK